jgi:hypothetical protein
MSLTRLEPWWRPYYLPLLLRNINHNKKDEITEETIDCILILDWDIVWLYPTCEVGMGIMKRRGMKGENGKVYDILTWAGSIDDQEGRWPRKATSIALGRGVYLASPIEESARHNLWQRRLAFARPPHQT